MIGCGSRTIAGGGALPDGATIDDPGIDDVPISTDVTFPDLPVRRDVIVPDVPQPDVPRRDVIFPDTPTPPDITFPDVPFPPDIFPDVPFPDVPFPDVVLPDVPAPDAPGLNGRCAAATPLVPGVTLTNQNMSAAAEAGLGCAPVGFLTAALWYRIFVPAGQTLTVSATRTATSFVNAQPRLQTACGGGMCLSAVSTTSSDGRTIVSRWLNTSDVPVTVFVAVTPVSPSSGGAPTTFDITATLRPPSSNSTCDRATEVSDGTALVGEDPSFSSTTLAPCPGMAGVTQPGALFYTVNVPAGQTLTAQASASVTGRGSYFIRVLGACADASCLAASPAGSATASTSWTNTAMTSRRVYIAVTPGFSGVSPFDLTVRVRPPPTNATCAGATRLTSGTLVGENLSFARDITATCLAFGASSGPVLYYTVRVGEGERLTVLARNSGSTFFTPLVRVIDGCGGLTCLASSAASPSGSTGSRITWVNPGPARDVVVLVSSSSSTAEGLFDLTTAVGPTPYRMTGIVGACDTLTAPTVVAGAVGDDVGTPSAPLPFAFRYFNGAVTSWSVSTNGYVQLWPLSGMSAGALGATELPASGAPVSMIAAFWDDLEVDAGTASVRSQTFAGASSHLTIEWNNLRFCCSGSTPDRLTFQVKLFETSNAIEMHYCSLGTSPRSSGGNASIGIQDSTTAQGLSWGIRRAGAASITTGVRFTPM